MDLGAILANGTAWFQATVTFLEHSFVFLALRLFLFVYVVVLFIDIVLLLWMRGITGDLSVTLHGTERPLISKNKMIIRWEKILERLEGNNPAQFKLAVLEAEALTEEVLSGIGWKGEHIQDRLTAVTDAQLESRSLLLEAHQVRNMIILDTQYQISKEEAQSTLEKYRRFFDEVELL